MLTFLSVNFRLKDASALQNRVQTYLVNSEPICHFFTIKNQRLENTIKTKNFKFSLFHHYTKFLRIDRGSVHLKPVKFWENKVNVLSS